MENVAAFVLPKRREGAAVHDFRGWDVVEETPL
jgi:hypothetical protein